MNKLGEHGETIGQLFGLPIVVDENLGKALPPIVTLSADNLTAAQLEEVRKKWDEITSRAVEPGHAWAVKVRNECASCDQPFTPESAVWRFGSAKDGAFVLICNDCYLELVKR